MGVWRATSSTRSTIPTCVPGGPGDIRALRLAVNKLFIELHTNRPTFQNKCMAHVALYACAYQTCLGGAELRVLLLCAYALEMDCLEDWVQEEIAKELEEIDLAELDNIEQLEEPVLLSLTAAEV